MTQPKIILNQLKQYLKTISQEESNTDITELFKRFPSVKEYYQIKLYHQSEQRSRKIVTDTSGIGWGFQRDLSK
jgi:hypothetical protein